MCTGIPLFNRSQLNPNEAEERMMYLIEVQIVNLNNAAFIDSLQLIVRGKNVSKAIFSLSGANGGCENRVFGIIVYWKANKTQLNCISYCVSEEILER